jgi:hypothetical protein
MGNGIDYGMGMTNIDRSNGIRYGVISMNDLSQWAWESFEPDYGPATCPKCGNEAEEYDSEVADAIEDEDGEACEPFKGVGKYSCSDYQCSGCRVYFGSDEAVGDEPHGHDCTEEGYTASVDSYNDVFIVRSPFYTRAAFCSPCAPGACHLASPCDDGDKTYCFGHDWFEDKKAPYPVYSVETNELVEP